jgi:hypothetical protein
MMHERFGDKYEKSTARAKLQSATQGNQRIRQFLDWILIQQEKAQFPEDQLCEFVIVGINRSLWEMVRHTPYPRNNFARLAQILETAESNWVERMKVETRRGSKGGYQATSEQTSYYANTHREVQSGNQGRPYQPKPSGSGQHRPSGSNQRPAQPQRSRSPDLKPMDIDRTRRVNLNQRRCFKCQKFGHFAKDCKVRKVSELSEEAKIAILEEHFAKINVIGEEDEPVEENEEAYLENAAVAEVSLDHSQVEGEDFQD